MKTKTTAVIIVCTLLLNHGRMKAQSADKVFPELTWVKGVGAKTIPQSSKIYEVTKFGAKNDGTTLNTKAIQAAIDACSAKGGGMVTFKPGIYLSGAIFLKKGVNFQIGKGVEIRGSQNIDDYPDIDTRVAGIEMRWPAALINISGQDNVAITGQGIVNGQGKPFWDKYWKMRKEYDPKGLRWIVDYDCKRPRTVVVSKSKNITIKGISLQQAGFWTVQLLYSKNVTVDGIVINNNINGKGPSTDGVDIDSSSDILIQNCDIDCNDDDFCLKSGRDADGQRVNIPTENVVIRDCIARKGGGLLTCGSETAGDIRNILAYNLKAHGTGNCINLKSTYTRGGTVENIYIHDVEMDSVGNPLMVTMNWNPAYSTCVLPAAYNYDSIPIHWKVILEKVTPEKGTPHFRNVHVSNIHGTSKKSAITATGMINSMAENFVIKNFEINAPSAGKIQYAKDWKFENIVIKAKDNSTLEFKDCVNVKL